MTEFRTPHTRQSSEAYNANPMEFTSVEERNAWIEARVDPDHTLPKVDLVPVLDNPEVVRFTTENDGVQTVIGFCSVDEGSEHFPLVRHLTWIELEDDYRGMGYGLAGYLALFKSLPLEDGMRSDYSLSHHAFLEWRTLESRGVAVSDASDEQLRDTWSSAAGVSITHSVRFRTIFGEYNDEALRERTRASRLEERRRSGLLSRFLGKLGITTNRS